MLNGVKATKELLNAIDSVKKPQTNADRIRSMGDDELCKFLGEYEFCDICEEWCDGCTYNGDCDKRLFDWLKQPAEKKVIRKL